MSSRTARQGQKRGQGRTEASLLRELTQELTAVLGARTPVVVQRLGTVVSLREQLETIAIAPRARRQSLQIQAAAILKAWASFRRLVEESDPAIAETMWASGDGFQPFLVYERALAPLRQLAGPRPGGRPTGARRALVLDDLMFALDAAGVDLFKTDGGMVEQAAIVVLRCLGDEVVDPGRDVAQAIDRFRADKTDPDNS